MKKNQKDETEATLFNEFVSYFSVKTDVNIKCNCVK